MPMGSHFLRKPFTYEELVQGLRSALDARGADV